jgi:hypothetical protein
MSQLRNFHGYRAFVTTPEVWAVLRARHSQDMQVHSSFSNPTGTAGGGDGSQGCMETTYGLDGSSLPLIGARTSWDIAEGDKRVNEQHEYFLFVAERNGEQSHE